MIHLVKFIFYAPGNPLEIAGPFFFGSLKAWTFFLCLLFAPAKVLLIIQKSLCRGRQGSICKTKRMKFTVQFDKNSQNIILYQIAHLPIIRLYIIIYTYIYIYTFHFIETCHHVIMRMINCMYIYIYFIRMNIITILYLSNLKTKYYPWGMSPARVRHTFSLSESCDRPGRSRFKS